MSAAVSAAASAAIERLLVLAHRGTEFSTMTTEHHATATGGTLETLIVVVGWLIVATVVAFALRYAIKPGEAGSAHIKRRVLVDDQEAAS